MLFTPHLLAGAAIGLVAEDWWWIIFLSLVFHLFFDLVPHYDPAYDRSRRYFLWSALDLLFGWILVLWLTKGFFSWKVLLGMLVSISPDILSFLIVFFKLRKLNWLVFFHKRIQTEWSILPGIGIQLLVVIILVVWRLVYMKN